MARGKKKEKELTIEERLEQALVPVEEQPYSVPENWCWVKFGVVCRFENGFAFKSDYFSKNGGVPVVRISNIVNNSITLEECVFTTETGIDEKYVIQQGDLLIAMSGATTGKNGIYNFEKIAYFNQRVGNIKVINKSILYDLFRNYYVLNIEREILNAAYGGAQPNISSHMICKMNFPLPPLAEQHRIVDRIESLFAKLDEAKEKAQGVIDGFETRKAAILHKAFTGELTAKWRKENNITLSSWKNDTIKNLCHSLKYGTAKKSHEHGSVIVIRMGNLQNGEIVWSNLAYTDDAEDIKKYKLSSGDVLFNRTNSPELVGKTSIYRGEFPAIYAGYLIKLDYDRNCILGDYLNYVLNSIDAKRYCNSVKTDGVNQSNINANKIGAFVISIPTIREQTKIVAILDDMLSKEKHVKETVEAVLDQIETIKKSILIRAFRGELGTNNPAEESAVELLKNMFM